jgi:ectoine hydroxylase-related dioxygenase (phytanoyl-CoA dioxygenase family)
MKTRAPETTAAALLGDPIDDAILAAYEQAGAIVVRGLIGPAWIAALRGSYGDMAASAYAPFVKGGKAEPGMRQLIQRHAMWAEDEAFRAFLFESPIARAAARLMRSASARLYEDILITEPAGGRAELSYHQDEPTWPVIGRQLSSVWFSLEPVGTESGALRFVSGSHRGPMYHPKYVKPDEAGDDVRFWDGGAFPEIDEDGRDWTIILTEAEPGDAVIFHPRAIHSAYGSSADHARRSFTIRFLGDDVRWQPKQRIFHRWMHELGLKEGDRIAHPRLPMVWEADAVAA